LNLQHGLRFLTDSLVLDSDVKIKNKTTISGFCRTKNWVERQYFFTLHFNREFDSVIELPKGPKENAPKYVLNFESLSDRQLQLKVALSSVSTDGAENNLNTELSHWKFDEVKNKAKTIWNSYLQRIEIEAPLKQKQIFYTAMYHALIHPSNIADVDGRYRGADDQIAKTESGEYYSTLSLWDTYRASHPLFTILTPERVDGFVETMLAHHKAQGYLPIWTAWGKENHCMIGNHAIPVITDAYMKGFKGFDADEALQAMIESTTENHLNSDWELYDNYGYYPFDFIDNEAVSRTLESGYDDYCVALLAEQLGKDSIAEVYYKRSKYYKNLFDPETKLMRGKDSKGNFRTPFEPLVPTSPMNNPGDYTEANAWQYSWASTQHDIEGFIELVGGKEAFTKLLDDFFSIEGEDNKHLGQEALIGQYAHGNEPSHHISYLYKYSNTPEKADQLIKQIYKQFYNNTPDGITGNDDCGQMSAWYIFSTLGFYPVNPANGEFVLGYPQVETAIIHLGDGNTFTIDTSHNGNIHLNSVLHKEKVIMYNDIVSGGTLSF
ncbi:MAG: glycoside hydrolase family 92 protein, partial [Bacteroidota bacterium]